MSPLSTPAFAGPKVAFLGDSLSTGGGSHERHVLSIAALLDIAAGRQTVGMTEDVSRQLTEGGFGVATDFAPPRRLEPSSREYRDVFSWMAKNLVQQISGKYIDIEQHAWGYVLARQQGYGADDILIAAEDGARMADAVFQIDRLLNVSKVMPEEIYLFFTGNDLCSYSLEQVTQAATFGQQLRSAITYLLRNGTAAHGGTKVYIVDPIGIMQLVQSPVILEKKVRLYGCDLTCADMQNSEKVEQCKAKELETVVTDPSTRPIDAQFASMTRFPIAPVQSCSTVFGQATDSNSKADQTFLANRLRSYRKEIGEVVRSAIGHGAVTDFTFYHLTSPGKWVLTAEAVADDCMHLSAVGQMQLAKLIQDELSQLKTP